MSLLIKALEQAAKDRKAGRAEAQPAAPDAPADAPLEPTLEPPPPPRGGAARAPAPDPAPAAPAPSSPLALDTGAPPRRAPSTLASLASIDAQQRARAATVMQASGGRSAEIMAFLRGNPVIALGGLAVLFGIGFGIYVYLQIAQPGIFTRQAATKAQPTPPPAPPPAPQAPPETAAASGIAGPAPYDSALAPPGTPPVGPAASAGAIGPQAGAPSPTAAPSQFQVPSASVIGPRQAMDAPRAATPERASETRRDTGSIKPRDPDRDPDRAPAAAPAARVATAPASPDRERIAVSPTAAQPRLNPNVGQAYSLLQSGEIEEARALYSNVLQAEPLNMDALLGLAYIAAKENRSDDATKLYVRILQLNPRHAIAQAALIGLMGRADPAASESRLKQLIAREPSPFLHFVLGNLYADQAQWSQAQQSYFQAHHLEPDNPDYAYNLAVGLDHLRQGKVALNFYRRAEQLASTQGRSNFNLSHARERIRILSSQAE
jgi:Tfp pilus assembly protein PilF